MFDSFEPFIQLQHQQFDFHPSRYEMWMGGQMVKSGNTTAPIAARVTQSSFYNKECTLVTINDLDLMSEITTENHFDVFITGIDRLQLITIPANGNDIECIGIITIKNIIGTTRRTKTFLKNEPYCCNLFLLKGATAKVTFAFNSPEKLIEFYS